MNAREPIGRFQWEQFILRLKLPDHLRLTALMLATWANRDGSQVRPGRLRLATYRDLSEKQVGRHVTELRRLGLLEITEKGNQYGFRTTVYRLTLPDDLADKVEILPEPPTEERTSKMSAARAGARDIQGGRSTNRAEDTQDVPSTTSAGDTQMSPAPASEPVDNSGAEDTTMSPAPGALTFQQGTSGGSAGDISASAGDTLDVPPPTPTPTPTPTHSSGSSPYGAEVEGAPAEPKTEDDSRFAGEWDYRGASAYLLTLADCGTAAVAEAETELGSGADREKVIIRAASIARSVA